MKLTYNPATYCYILRGFGNGLPEAQPFMVEYGLDYAKQENVLFTRDPYCAASFQQYADVPALAQLGTIGAEIAASSALSSDRHIDVPADRQLMPYQAADVDYIMRRFNDGEHAADCDEPGLGKTPTAIACANEMQAKRIVVVCPASVRIQWEKRVREWSTLRDPHLYTILSGQHGTSPGAHWTIISFELARNPRLLRALLREGPYDLLIVDEVHYAKTVDTARSRALFGYHDKRHQDDGQSEDRVTAGLSSVCERILVLSGTPFPNRPRESYNMLHALNWAAIDWLSEKAFNERFNPRALRETKDGKRFQEEAEGRLPELQNRLRANIMCRHLESQVRDQLAYKFPEPLIDLIQVEETGAVKQALEAERMLSIDPETLQGKDLPFFGEVSTVRKMMGIAMAPLVAAYIRMLLQTGSKKLVVFAWHIEVLNILGVAFGEYGCVRVDGSSTAHQKERLVKQFIEDPTIDVIIGNTLSLGVGTDGLQKVAHHVLLAEPDWVPGNNEQPIRRLNRIGQTTRVLADMFVAPNSIAERVLATALRKGLVLHKTLDRSVEDVIEAWS
jgi:SWI/SNF-related matrix-associated actin-dependent regulator 1 of chromatin subfamily A